jgi:hypothetical protein
MIEEGRGHETRQDPVQQVFDKSECVGKVNTSSKVWCNKVYPSSNFRRNNSLIYHNSLSFSCSVLSSVKQLSIAVSPLPSLRFLAVHRVISPPAEFLGRVRHQSPCVKGVLAEPDRPSFQEYRKNSLARVFEGRYDHPRSILTHFESQDNWLVKFRPTRRVPGQFSHYWSPGYFFLQPLEV